MKQTPFDSWAHRWNIPEAAIAELGAILGAADSVDPTATNGSEQHVQNRLRVATSRMGWRMWRNNVGAFKTPEGSFVRYGLANDTPAMNRSLKSSDLVGIRPVPITEEMVGCTLGQFVALEVKRPNWKFTGSPREVAQMRFLGLVTKLGGHARFIKNEGELNRES